MDVIPTHSFLDPGSFNLRDLDTGLLVGKVFVESAAQDVAGGRGYTVHTAVTKSSTGDTGWGVYAKPTQLVDKSFKYEGTGETLAQFVTWAHDSSRKSHLVYIFEGTREQDAVP